LRADEIIQLDPRGRLLVAALGFAGCSMPSYDRALWALRTWLDSWTGIGHVAVGMHRQGYDLQLTQYDERGRRATYTTGMEHSPTSATGTGRERTPWRASQRAAWEALRQMGKRIVSDVRRKRRRSTDQRSYSTQGEDQTPPGW
jgi:hypothetical protein